MSNHELKTVNPFFQEVKLGKKNFEIRNNDRNFQIYDLLILKEYIPETDSLTGDVEPFPVMSILTNELQLQPGYVVLGKNSYYDIGDAEVKPGDKIYKKGLLEDVPSAYTEVEVIYSLTHKHFPQGIRPGFSVYSFQLTHYTQ